MRRYLRHGNFKGYAGIFTYYSYCENRLFESSFISPKIGIFLHWSSLQNGFQASFNARRLFFSIHWMFLPYVCHLIHINNRKEGWNATIAGIEDLEISDWTGPALQYGSWATPIPENFINLEVSRIVSTIEKEQFWNHPKIPGGIRRKSWLIDTTGSIEDPDL